jgi:predicted DNA-binding transcriptional regulator YafY
MPHALPSPRKTALKPSKKNTPAAAPAPLLAASGRQVATGPAALMRMEEIHRRIREAMRDPTHRSLPTIKGLTREWGGSVNTVRDAVFLLEVFNAPLHPDRSRGLFYTDPNWVLRPPLFLGERQKLALLIASCVASRSRTFPLAGDLVSGLQQVASALAGVASFSPETLDSMFSTADVIPSAREADHFALLWDAIAQRRAVRVEYRKAKPGAASEPRLLHPLHWVIRHDACTVITHDPKAGKRRNFKLTRFEEVRLTDDTFEWPAGFDLKRYLSGAFGNFIGEPVHDVRVHFDRDYVPFLRENEWQHGQVIVEQPDGSAEVTFHVCHTAELEQYVLRTGGLAQVIEPADVRQRIHAAAAKIMERHR